MLRSLYIASSGMQAQQMNLDVISNNLANVNTTGFKKSRVDFQSLLYQSLKSPAASEQGFFNPMGLEIGNGVRVVGTLSDFSGGILQETGNDSDVAIQGKGFFMVALPNGKVGYTRNGAFQIDSQGYLVTSNGYRVLSSKGNDSTGGSLSVGGKTLKYIKPDTATKTISISEDGIVSTEKVSGASAPILEMANFANPAGLQAVGSTSYVATEVSGEPIIGQPTKDGLGSLIQGFLEGSNVKVVEEMVKMITAQRAYEINSKSIQTSDEMMGITNGLKR
ncbi:flagellar basal-body rod protein FlgF [Thermanaerosceptrum fracticalcis]|uniref:Flagellar basal-body rod protein FlgF n=1 Tax=Thermanaerosceptrum fracticalcis TaxID=1712410 RepID=A0A7G6E4M7_THEFR|nr:flagellar basal-body rod protein FlgF [Thermanaerosceptrum fracticalcis]QNB47031.1 flagellar basal-body rod protein FlgF [Thermanaerosceptrum fracticalcis]